MAVATRARERIVWRERAILKENRRDRRGDYGYMWEKMWEEIFMETECMELGEYCVETV